MKARALMFLVVAVFVLAGIWLLYPHEACAPRDARLANAGANMNTICVNLLSYQLNVGRMPTTEQGLRALVERPESVPLPVRWCKVRADVPRDSWGREFQYRYPGSKNPESYDLFSFGPDGEEGTEDDVGARQFRRPQGRKSARSLRCRAVCAFTTRRAVEVGL